MHKVIVDAHSGSEAATCAISQVTANSNCFLWLRLPLCRGRRGGRFCGHGQARSGQAAAARGGGQRAAVCLARRPQCAQGILQGCRRVSDMLATMQISALVYDLV